MSEADVLALSGKLFVICVLFSGGKVGILLLAETLHRACKPNGLAGSLADDFFCSTIVIFERNGQVITEIAKLSRERVKNKKNLKGVH